MKDSELSRMFFHWAKARVQAEIKRLKEEFETVKEKGPEDGPEQEEKEVED